MRFTCSSWVLEGPGIGAETPLEHDLDPALDPGLDDGLEAERDGGRDISYVLSCISTIMFRLSASSGIVVLLPISL